MNIKKILAGSLAAITVGATALFAVAATPAAVAATPAGLADYVPLTVVIGGAGVDATDVIGAADIAAAVAGYSTTSTTCGGAVTTVSGGALIDSDMNKTYLGQSTTQTSKVKWQSISSPATYTALTKRDLPDLLASYEYTPNLNTENTSTVVQQIKLIGQYVTYGKPSGGTTIYTEPTLYTTFDTNTPYNLTVYFLGGLDIQGSNTQNSLTLFGRDYNFGAAANNVINYNGHPKMELYSSTGAATVTLSGIGDEATVTVGGVDYTIKLTTYVDADTVQVQVNGEATTPSAWDEGNTYTLPGTSISTYVSDVTVAYTDPNTAVPSVTLFVGVDKLTLEDGQPIIKNTEAITGTQVTFTNTSEKITSLELKITPILKTFLTEADDYTDPVFGSFKFALGGMDPAATSDSRDLVAFEKSGTAVQLTFTNYAGTEYTTNVFYANNATGWSRTIDGTYDVHVYETNTTTTDDNYNIDLADYFVVSSGKNSYILKYAGVYPSSTNSKAYVTLQDIATGTSYKVYPAVSGQDVLRIGADTFKVENLSSAANSFDIAVDLNGDGLFLNTTKVNITTSGEAKIDLTTFGAPGTIGASAQANVTENPLYTISGSNEPTGESLNVSVSYSAAEELTFTVEGGSGAFCNQQVGTGATKMYRDMSDYGTFCEKTTDTDYVKLYLPGNRPSPALVAIGTDPSFTTSEAETVETVSKITTPVAKFVSDLTADPATYTATGNLILVGGPCANGMVAQLAETDPDIPTCADWNLATGIIKEVSDAFGAGNKALVVAGTTAADTRSLAASVMGGTLSFKD